MAQAKKGLGRGLSVLIPDDMDFLAEVARGDFSVLKPPAEVPTGGQEDAAPSSVSRETSSPNSLVSPTTTAEFDPLVAALAPTDLRMVAPWDDKGAGEDVVQWVSPDSIEANPYQPRRHFDRDELANLADSIREHGILQPLIVRPMPHLHPSQPRPEPDGAHVDWTRYQLIAGERRWRAAQQAKMLRLPVIVRALSDQQALELAIIENVQRHDLSAIDAAVAYKRLASEFGLTQEKIAQRVGKSRTAITNAIRLLELPAEVQEALQDGTLSEGHGKAILMAPPDAHRSLLSAIVRDKLSVRDAEEFARRVKHLAQRDTEARPPEQAQRAGAMARSPMLEPGEHEDKALEEQLQRALSCRVQVRRRRSGGQIVLFADEEGQIERLAQMLAAWRR